MNLSDSILKKSQNKSISVATNISTTNFSIYDSGGWTDGGMNFLGESKIGSKESFEVEGGVMNTTYGVIFLVIGGGVKSPLIAVIDVKLI